LKLPEENINDNNNKPIKMGITYPFVICQNLLIGILLSIIVIIKNKEIITRNSVLEIKLIKGSINKKQINFVQKLRLCITDDFWM
jgi:hypothetical protein